jgi:hypothetical protein
MNLKSNSYRKLSNGEIVKINYDKGKARTLGSTTYGGTVLCETESGEKKELKREDVLAGKEIAYRPSISKIGRLALSLPEDDGPEFFFEKLIEFGHLRIQTLGYYTTPGDRRKNSLKDNLVSSLAYKLSEHVSFSPEAQKTWKKWASGDKKAGKALFKDPRRGNNFILLRAECACPVTGCRFDWKCDGRTTRPLRRRLFKSESDAKREMLKGQWEKLKAKANRDTTEEALFQELNKVFKPEEKQHWMVAQMVLSRLADKGPAQSFKKLYADPKTGQYPKAVVEIDIPSGELVFANSLFDYLKDFPKEELHEEENNVCHTHGRNRVIEFHARENQAFYVPLSNNSPEVWQSKRKPSSLRVGRAAEEPKKGQWSYAQAKKDWNECGRICTDLWAFHAVDRTRLPEKIEVDHFIVKLPPGRYRLTNHYEHEGYKTGIFCEIEKAS